MYGRMGMPGTVLAKFCKLLMSDILLYTLDLGSITLPLYRDGNRAKARLINFLYPSSYYIAKVGLQARNPGSAACL